MIRSKESLQKSEKTAKLP